MPDKRFLEEYGLYRKFVFVDDELRNVEFAPSILRFCDHPLCNTVTTWNKTDGHWCGRVAGAPHDKDGILRSYNDHSKKRKHVSHHHVQPKTPAGWSIVFYNYTCNHCYSNEVSFIVRVEYVPAKENEKPKWMVEKVGQYPPFSIEPPVEVKAVLGETFEPIYRKGIICEGQGYGIGAYAYYRRIVEGIVDTLLDDVAMLLTEEQRIKYQAELDKLDSTIVASDKIAVVKEFVPTNMRPGGANPLGILHDALSGGIHDWEDDECLELAVEIRNALIGVYKYIQLAKTEPHHTTSSVQKISDVLAKRKARSDKRGAKAEKPPSGDAPPA